MIYRIAFARKAQESAPLPKLKIGFKYETNVHEARAPDVDLPGPDVRTNARRTNARGMHLNYAHIIAPVTMVRLSCFRTDWRVRVGTRRAQSRATFRDRSVRLLINYNLCASECVCDRVSRFRNLRNISIQTHARPHRHR